LAGVEIKGKKPKRESHFFTGRLKTFVYFPEVATIGASLGLSQVNLVLPGYCTGIDET
jgi:hypothetical protein